MTWCFFFVFLVAVGCEKTGEPELPMVQFRIHSLELIFKHETALDSIQIDSDRFILLQSTQKIFSVPYQWEANRDYSITYVSGGLKRSVKQRSPHQKKDYDVFLTLPFGQNKTSLIHKTTDTLYVPSQVGQASFIIELNKKQVDLQFQSFGAFTTNFKHTFYPFGTNNFVSFHTNKVEAASWLYYTLNDVTDSLYIVPVLKEDFKKHLIVAEPFIAKSDHELFKNTDFIVERRSERLLNLASYFTGNDTRFDEREPDTFLRVLIYNPYSFTLMINGTLLFENSERFKVTDEQSVLFGEQPKATAHLSPYSYSELKIPLYIDYKKVVSEEFPFELQLQLFGGKETFYRFSNTLKLEPSKEFEWFLFGGLFLLGTLVFLYVFFRLPHFINQFSVRTLITIAIFGSLHFVFQYVATFLNLTFLSFLGPFKEFVSGFFREGLYYFILVTLITIYPKPGVITLKLFISSLLGMVLQGSFSITLFYGMGLSILLLETASYLSGYYKERTSWLYRMNLILLLSMADFLLSYVQLFEIQTLYRIYYADWFVWSYSLIIGFLYTAFAVYGSFPFSIALQKVVK